MSQLLVTCIVKSCKHLVSKKSFRFLKTKLSYLPLPGNITFSQVSDLKYLTHGFFWKFSFFALPDLWDFFSLSLFHFPNSSFSVLSYPNLSYPILSYPILSYYIDKNTYHWIPFSWIRTRSSKTMTSVV